MGPRQSVEEIDANHASPTPPNAAERLIPRNTSFAGRNYRQLSLSPSPHPQSRAIEIDEEANRSNSKGSSGADQVTWSSLPRKGQLIILTLARLSEPLTQTSLQSYLYYQLASFDPSQPPSQVTSQAGVVIAAFAAAQAVTALFWGTVADAQWGGRKFVIIVGLCGTGLGSLGYGFSGSWQTAVAWRLLAGSLNGNVGVMRTMISEIVKEKK
jgi:Major Facilitator Superfamily